MNTNNLDHRAKIRLYLLTFIFIIAEVIFGISVVQFGNEDIFGLVLKSLFFLVFIFLSFKRYTWAKWVLSISLILYGVLCFFAGIGQESLILKLLAIYFIYFGVILHLAKPFKSYFVKARKPGQERVFEVNQIKGDNRTLEYPLLVKRYQAVFVDGMLILLFISIITFFLDQSGNDSLYFKLLGIFLIISYEPILTTYKSTLGQYLLKIRVRKSTNPKNRINLMQAYSRVFVKGVLGWLSFITINFNAQHKAIHDYVASTIVVNIAKIPVEQEVG